jgi:hypothetical protein
MGDTEKHATIEVGIPFGTKTAELAKIGDRLFEDFGARLPRGGQASLSGEALFTRARMEQALRIDLDAMDLP